MATIRKIVTINTDTKELRALGINNLSAFVRRCISLVAEGKLKIAESVEVSP